MTARAGAAIRPRRGDQVVPERRVARKRGGRRGERSTGSCVYFQRFNTFGPVKNKDWVLTLPEGEKVLGCATGVGWNAVVTR